MQNYNIICKIIGRTHKPTKNMNYTIDTKCLKSAVTKAMIKTNTSKLFLSELNHKHKHSKVHVCT